MAGPLYPRPKGADVVTQRSIDALVRSLERPGVIEESYVVPLYDDGSPVSLVAEEESDAGPTALVGAAWATMLTVSLDLTDRLAYQIEGTASCDVHLQGAASAWETVAIRVSDGTTTYHTLYGSTVTEGHYVPITVPFTLDVHSTSLVSLNMDASWVLTNGAGPPLLERMRLIAVAIPIHLEGSSS